MMRIVVIALLALSALATLVTSITLVRPGERAVVRRFGAFRANKPEPGLLLTLPWWMDRVDRVRVDERRTVKVGWTGIEEDKTPLPAGQLLTGDHNLVNAEAEIHYRVVDNKVNDFVLNGGQAESLIARATEAALGQWLAGQRIDDILRLGRSLLPSLLVEDVQHRIAPYHLGIRIELVDIKLSPPADVKPYFDAVSEQHTRITTQINEATSEAKKKLSEAKTEEYRKISEARAYANEQNKAAIGDAETFLKRLDQYWLLSKNNPNYLNDMWLDDVTRLYTVMRQSGRIDLLDHYIGNDGLNITQFPLPPRRR
jgi:modulator of FtsH protease HflK